MKNWLMCVLLFLGYYASSQEIVCSREDRQVFDQKISEFKKLNADTPGGWLVEIGKTFIGTPYVANTLEINPSENLIINFRELDCTTFVENVLAFAILQKRGDIRFQKYTEILQGLRYRDGERSGYASRLHYFSEWISNNEQKGLVKDISLALGGISVMKSRHFMTSHRNLYPHLKARKNYEALRHVEAALMDQPISYIPSKSIARHEKDLQDGDIIALATSIDGLDVTHTGIASREADGRIYLLHASSKGQVELSPVPLIDYLSGIKNNIGILVARPIF